MPIGIRSPCPRTHASNARYPARVVEKLRVPRMVPAGSMSAATWISQHGAPPPHKRWRGAGGAAVLVSGMMVMSCSDLFAWAGTGPAHHQTGGQDSDEHLLAQALLRSLRR